MSLREVTFLGKDHSCHLTLMALLDSQQGLKKEEFFPSGRAQLELKFRWDSRVLPRRNCHWVGNLISLTIHPVLVNDWPELSGKTGLLWSPHTAHKWKIGQHCMLFGRMEETTQTPHTSACVESGTSINSGCSRTSGFTGGVTVLSCLLGGDQLYLSHCRDTYFRCYLRGPQNQMALSPSLVMQLLCRKRKEPRSSSKTTGT